MSPTPPLPVTEDTPPDMLAGSMDLQIVLPSGKSVKMSVERSTPMMDLLVQVTTANKVAPGSHVLQALGERGVLPYKPSTPIGTLDTWTIHVIPKSRLGSAAKKAPLKPSNQQPFEQTFRLQVHLPRNQLFVTRTSAKIALSDILCQVCAEKNFDPTKYELRHPGNVEEVLELGCSLADYKLQEVVLVAKTSRPLSASLSSTDIMVLHREEEKRRQQAKSGSSSSTSSRFFGVFKKNRSSVGEGSVSSDSLGGRSVSPARSDESISRSASPPAPGLPPTMVPPPSRPQRKRRPAPAPPSDNNKLAQQQDTRAQQSSSNKDEGKGGKGTLMSHSRNSSDSSGYHEASVLSESPDSHTGPQTFDSSSSTVDSLPRRSKLTTAMADHSHALSRSLSSLAASAQDSRPPTKPSVLSASTTTLSSAGQMPRKKRAAPPPPKSLADKPVSDVILEDKLKTASLDRHLRDKDAALLDKSASLPAKVKLPKQEGSVSSFDSASKASLRSASSVEEDELFEPEELEDPAPPPRIPSPQLAPVVEPPVASRPEPVEARLDPVVAIPTPKPRARVATLEKSDPHASTPVPRPRKMSADTHLDVTEGTHGEAARGTDWVVLSKAGSVHVVAVEKRGLLDATEDKDAGEVHSNVVFLKDRLLSDASDAASVTSSINEDDNAGGTTLQGKHVVMSKMKSDTDMVHQFLRSSFNRGSRRGKPRGRTSNGSVTSLHSMDDVPHFLNDAANIGRWGSVEALDAMNEAEEAIRQSAWVLGADDSDVEVDLTEGVNLGNEFLCETATDEGVVPEVMMPQPVEQVQSMSIIARAVERLPESGMALPDPVAPPSPEDGKEEPLDIDWEYQLPAPPSAFRDRASPSVVAGETVTLARETEGSVDSGDFSLTDVAEHPRAEKSLEDFGVHISGGEITRINPLFDPHQFENSSEETTQSLFASREPTLVEADHNWSSKSKEETPSRKLSETEDCKKFTDERARSHSAGVVDAFQPHQLSNFKISTYQGRRDIDSIFREAEAESSATKNWEFKEPLPVAKRAYRYGSVNSLEAAGVVRANSLGRDEVDTKLALLPVKRSTSHISLASSGNVAVEKQPQTEQPGRTPSLGNLSGELPVATSRVQELRRDSGTQDRLVAKARSELDLHQVGNEVLNDDLVHNPNPQKTVIEEKKETPLQSLQILRTILPHMIHSKGAEDVQNTSSTNNASKPSNIRSSAESVSERRMSDSSKSQSSGSERQEQANEEAGEKRYRYQGPPAIKLSSWNERPKVKVDIKQDSDYRIGKEIAGKVKVEDAESRLKVVASGSVAKVGTVEPSKVEQTPLTMRLVSNTPGRKGLSTSQILESISRPEPPFEFIPPPTKEPAKTSVHVGKTHADPSRVPIVRAVELKKPFQQQLQSGSGVSINIVRQDEEVFVGGERVDGQVKDGGFAGVNSLARMFSGGTLKPYKNTRPLSAYEYSSGNEKPSDGSSIFIDGARKHEDFANNLCRSSSITNLSAPSVTVNSSESAAPKKYTSVVGINKSGNSVQFAPGSSVVKVNGFSGQRPLAPVVKGFRLASQPASSVSVRIEHQTPTEVNGSHTRVQRSESAFVKSTPFSARDQSPAVVKVHEKPLPWKSSVTKTRSLPASEAVPPPPPPFLADVALKKVDRQQPKNSTATMGDVRGELMDAIRNHGGRDTLKKTSRTEANTPNIILRV